VTALAVVLALVADVGAATAIVVALSARRRVRRRSPVDLRDGPGRRAR